MNGPSDPSARVMLVPAIALVAAAAFSYGFVPLRASNDVWWHLKAGKVIVEAGGRLPEYDVFTYPAEVEKIAWHNHEWLAQVIFYQIFDWGGGVPGHLIGLRALIGFKALMLAATFLLVFVAVQQRCRCLPLAALIALLALDVSRRTLYPRPPVFTYLFLALFLLVLHNWKAKRWPRATLFVLPPLTAVWANLHGGFLVGLIVVFLYGLGEVAEYFFWRNGRKETGAKPFAAAGSKSDEAGTTPDAARDERARRPYAAAESESGRAEGALEFRSRMAWLGGTLVACVLGSLCTPYHVYLYILPLRVMRHSALVSAIGEMGSPLAPHVAPYYVSFFAMGALLVIGLGAARALRRERPAAADILILLFFGYEAVRHIRHLPLFAIATAPILGWAVGQMLAPLGESRRRNIAWLTMAIAFLIGWYGVAQPRSGDPISYWDRNRALAAGQTYYPDQFPKDVCDFIIANGFEGRMFNPINVAGYMIWRLSPEPHKLFTDSRFDVFGDRFVWHEEAVREGKERDDWARLDPDDRTAQHKRERVESAGWADILDQWNVNFIVAERSWDLVKTQKLRLSGNWERVFYWLKPPFRDPYDGYEIFVRRTDANRELIRRCRLSFEQLQKRDPRYGREPL